MLYRFETLQEHILRELVPIHGMKVMQLQNDLTGRCCATVHLSQFGLNLSLCRDGVFVVFLSCVPSNDQYDSKDDLC